MQNRENNDEMEQPLPLPPVAPRRQTGDSREVSESEFYFLSQVYSDRAPVLCQRTLDLTIRENLIFWIPL